MDKLIVILFLFSLSLSSYAQSDAFDFWLGEWELSWKGPNDEMKKGTNKIERILNNQVIRENFTSLDGDESSRFEGKSWTVFNTQTQLWKQTWVDNSGAYLDFTGFVEDSIKGFQRSFTNKADVQIYQRMIFYNISSDAFTWDWQSSKDAINWTLLWRINYKRKRL